MDQVSFYRCLPTDKKIAPHTRIYSSIHHASGIEYLPYIDVFVRMRFHEDLLLGDKVRAGGKDKYFWQYTGVGAGSERKDEVFVWLYFGAFDSTRFIVVGI